MEGSKLCQKASSRVLNFPYISLYFFPANYGSRLVCYRDKCMDRMYSGLKNLKIITATFIMESLGFILLLSRSRGCNSQKEGFNTRFFVVGNFKNKNPAAQLRRSETRFRSSGAGNTLPVSIPRNAVAQLKMADNHGRTTGRN